jgi:molybdopterin/thiamine biosynthesis adenylyltransferase
VSGSLEEAARGAIHVTLKSRGFRQTSTVRGAPVYQGTVKSGSLAVRVELIIPDPLLISAPKVRVLDVAISDRIKAHVDDKGDLCYTTTAFEEYDIYNGGGAILRCLANVQATLNLVLHGNPIDDRYREFISYWQAPLTLQADLPPDFIGVAGLYRRTAKDADLLVATPTTAAAWSGLIEPTPPSSVKVIRTATPLVVADGKWAGRSWASFRRWIAKFITSADLARLAAADVADGGLVAVIAPNGAIAARFEWPTVEAAAFRKAPPHRRTAWIEKHPEHMTLQRYNMKSVARLDLVNARLAEPSHLTRLKVAVVGVGAIGGRLALDLVRSGAGGPDNPLCLIDPDVLAEENLGRHVLGFEALGRPKVEAVAAEAKRFHPSVTVKTFQQNVLDCLPLLNGFDLVIDATGHNPLALRLNAHATEARRARAFPPIIHAAVHGNGLAVQSILVTGSDHACLKCLRPGHGEFKANPLKPGVQTERVAATCGDGAFIPYAATAPAVAAALALQAALEWSARPDDPGPRTRTRRLSFAETVSIKDKSWSRDSACPACGDRPDVAQ